MYHKKEKHGCIWEENDAEQIKVQAPGDNDNEDQSIPSVCKFCEEDFQTKADLMKHKKDNDVKEVQVCW